MELIKVKVISCSRRLWMLPLLITAQNSLCGFGGLACEKSSVKTGHNFVSNLLI